MSIHADPTYVRFEMARRYEQAGADASHLYDGSPADPYGVSSRRFSARLRGVTSTFLARRHAAGQPAGPATRGAHGRVPTSATA